MSIFGKLFGGRKDAAPGAAKTASQDYDGFRITPEPIKEGGQFRIAARIEKEVGGVPRSHHLIRADTMADFGQACEASVGKARQMIDEQGERLFRD